MNILFTGCSSYIGKYLIEKFLREKKYKIFGISRNNPKITNKKFKWFKHDLTKSPFKKIKKIDVIIMSVAPLFVQKTILKIILRETYLWHII